MNFQNCFIYYLFIILDVHQNTFWYFLYENENDWWKEQKSNPTSIKAIRNVTVMQLYINKL